MLPLPALCGIDAKTAWDKLSLREQQVAVLAAQGHKDKKIAGKLDISDGTVAKHLDHIFNKLGMHDRISLALFVMHMLHNNPMLIVEFSCAASDELTVVGLGDLETHLARIAEEERQMKKETLTVREMQTSLLMAQGKKREEMCELLNVQEYILRRDLNRVFKKLGISNQLALALFVMNLLKYSQNFSISSEPQESVSIVGSKGLDVRTVSNMAGEIRLGASDLTAREVEVCNLVAQGFHDKDIADKLFISEETVGNHFNRIFRKMDIHDRMELALYVICHGLPEPRLDKRCKRVVPVEPLPAEALAVA